MGRIKISSAKAKGRNLQKWACEKISELLAISWGFEDDKLIQPRLMGQSGTDVILRGDAYNKFNFDIECKSTEKISLYKDIEQARNNTREGRNWLLIHKRNRSKPIIILDAQVFFDILFLIKEGKNDKEDKDK